MKPQTRILFVDDEAYVLDALRRAMRSMRNEWEMSFAKSGAEALALLQEHPADVVVSDMRMQGMSGRELLEEVRRLYPSTVRFILSGHTEPSAIMLAASAAHQYIAKPCDAVTLKTALTRVRQLRELLVDDAMASCVGGGESLLSLPTIYPRIVALVQAPGASVSDVARAIEEDMAMSTMLLKVANSAYFGATTAVRTTERAVAFLGIDNVTSLVLANGVVYQSEGSTASTEDIARLWSHSLDTAAIARSLAHYEGWPAARVEDAFLAGMLHDLGQLVMATSPSRVGDSPCAQASHDQVGAYLIGLWGFPSTIVEAVAFHHQPTGAAEKGISLPGILHAANVLSHARRRAPCNLHDAGLDAEFVELPGMDERWDAWQACVTDAANARTGAA